MTLNSTFLVFTKPLINNAARLLPRSVTQWMQQKTNLRNINVQINQNVFFCVWLYKYYICPRTVQMFLAIANVFFKCKTHARFLSFRFSTNERETWSHRLNEVNLGNRLNRGKMFLMTQCKHFYIITGLPFDRFMRQEKKQYG